MQGWRHREWQSWILPVLQFPGGSPSAPTLVCHEDLPIRAHSLFLSLISHISPATVDGIPSDPLRDVPVRSTPCHLLPAAVATRETLALKEVEPVTGRG